MPVIGFLDNRSPHTIADQLRAFRQGLKDAGYVEGENVAIEHRWAQDQFDRLPALAAELVRRRVAVIITNGGPPAAVAALSRRRGDRIEALGIMQGRQARCANFQDAGSALPENVDTDRGRRPHPETGWKAYGALSRAGRQRGARLA
jgi:hypothetical protein